jgi:hypothetical protein
MSLLFITTAATDRALLTVAEARSAIGNTSADVTALIAQVSSSIARACKVRAAGASPVTLRLEVLQETFRLKSAQDCLILSRRPVTAIATVTENDELVDDDDYELDASSGILRRLSDDNGTCWPCGKIIIAYRAGWATVPDDLKLMAMKLAAVLYSEGQRVDPNLKSESIPGVRDVEYWVAPSGDPLIPQEILDGLAPYMNYPVG